MGHITNDERREYMAGLMELVNEKCALNGLVYCEEMATLMLAWLSAESRVDRDIEPSPSKMILPEVPPVPAGVCRTPRKVMGVVLRESTKQSIKEGDEPKPLPTVLPKLSPMRRGSSSFVNGQKAAANGKDRGSCPILQGQGGYQAAWLTGFDEAMASKNTHERDLS